MVYFLVKMAG